MSNTTCEPPLSASPIVHDEEPDLAITALPEIVAKAPLPTALVVAADRLATALVRRFGPLPAILVSAVRFAPGLPARRALEWSIELRAVGLEAHCPLVARSADPTVPVVERARAAATAHAAFVDPRSGDLVAEALRVAEDADRATVLAELAILAPALLGHPGVALWAEAPKLHPRTQVA